MDCKYPCDSSKTNYENEFLQIYFSRKFILYRPI